jgi:hypothetical protein
LVNCDKHQHFEYAEGDIAGYGPKQVVSSCDLDFTILLVVDYSDAQVNFVSKQLSAKILTKHF